MQLLTVCRVRYCGCVGACCVSRVRVVCRVCVCVCSTFFRELVGTALWFGTYETVCRTLAADAGDASDAPPLIQLLAGGCAGCIYWGVPYPMDTVKSRIQIKQATEQTSIFKMFVEVLKEEGVRGLYRGIGPTMMRAIPGSAVALFTYERSSRFLDWLKEEKPHLCPSFF